MTGVLCHNMLADTKFICHGKLWYHRNYYVCIVIPAQECLCCIYQWHVWVTGCVFRIQAILWGNKNKVWEIL